MEEIVKHINDTNASFRTIGAGDAKNTDLFLDNEHYEMFRDAGEQITVRFNKENLQKAILFITSILPRKYDNSATHKTVQFSTTFVFDQLAFLESFFTVNDVKVETRTQIWNARKDVIKNNGEIDKRFYFNGLLEEIVYTNYKGQPVTAKFTIRNYLAGGYSDLHIKKADDGIFDVWVTNTLEHKDDGKERQYEEIDNSPLVCPLQQIIYGAPGTGKSHEIKESTATADKEGRVIRTTFHPDSDYSTFVGAYKPTSVEVPVMTMIGTKAVPAENPDGTQRKEKKIVYEFVPQAFLKAYTGAWKNQDDPFFLIIEEINRGNCAQIFGDLFQLLDRNDKTEQSEYPISPDEDIQKFLLTDKKYGFANLTEEQKSIIPNEVKNGELLILPKNLHIWATMNTSDQSLFPIDSAFKRRWDWKYIPIDNANKGWKIEVNGKRYDWWKFLDTINKKIYHFTHSEDKKMGYFFCKPKDSIIDIETFVGKVIFYIWNDVFKDIVEEAGDLFKDADNTSLSFNKFYSIGKDGKAKVVADKVELFLQNVGVEPEKVDNNPVLDEDGNDVASTGNRNFDYTKYSINGKGSYPKGRVAQEAISLFISLHPEMSDIDVVNTWVGLNVKIPNIVETSQMFASRTSSSSDPGLSNRFKTVQMPNGNILYVSNQYNVERVNDLIEKVNAQPWGIHIERI